jgi:hypothetical protein
MIPYLGFPVCRGAVPAMVVLHLLLTHFMSKNKSVYLFNPVKHGTYLNKI